MHGLLPVDYAGGSLADVLPSIASSLGVRRQPGLKNVANKIHYHLR